CVVEAEPRVLVGGLLRVTRVERDVVEVVVDVGRRLDEADANAFPELDLVSVSVGQEAACAFEIRNAERDMLDGPAIPRALRREERQLAATGVRPDEREVLLRVDDVHAEVLGREVDQRVPVRHPEGDVVQCLRLHAASLAVAPSSTSDYFRLSTARWSWAFVICERPVMFRRLASLYSCSLVRPFGLVVPERSPPRRPDEMSRVEVRDARPLASPERARSLLTVRAAISFARFVERPCFFSDSLMCSY